MGVIAALAGLRVHVLVVDVPGFPLLRIRAEAAVRARGWVLVRDPAAADLLLVCGEPDGAAAVDAVAALWSRMASPRAKRVVLASAGLPAALDSAARVLGDDDLQRAARLAGSDRSLPPPPIAVRVLGPVAPDWPAGVVLRCTVIAGEVVTAGVVELPPRGHEEDPLGGEAAALVLAADRAARLLRLAGLPGLASPLLPVVDRVLAGGRATGERRLLASVARALDRSVRLRWALAAAGADELHDRIVGLVVQAERAAAGAPAQQDPVDTGALGVLLRGRTIAAVPLLVTAATGTRTAAAASGTGAAVAAVLGVLALGAVLDALAAGASAGPAFAAPLSEAARAIRRRQDVPLRPPRRAVPVVLAVLPAEAVLLDPPVGALLVAAPVLILLVLALRRRGWGAGPIASLALPLGVAAACPLVAAGSLDLGEIVAAQRDLPFAVQMPVAGVVLLVVLAVAGPRADDPAPDPGRAALLVAGAVLLVALLLGGLALGWRILATGTALTVLVGVARAVPSLPARRLARAARLLLLPLALVQLAVVVALRLTA